MADVLAVAATCWGLLMAVSPLLQIRRMFQTGSSADISVAYLAVLQPGFVLWLTYGVSLGNPALVISNSAALLFGLLTILVAVRLRRSDGRREAARARDGAAAPAPEGEAAPAREGAAARVFNE